MQRYQDEIEEEEEVEVEKDEPPPIFKRKWFRFGGCLQIIAGATTLAIGLITGGAILIPIIGGYFIANGLLNTVIKI